MHYLAELRAAARAKGLHWSWVAGKYADLRAADLAAWERPAAIRQAAWERMVSEGSKPFWRHGFAVRWPRAFAEGDRTLIPGFDVVAADVAAQYPELDNGGDAAEALYDLLARPYRRQAKPQELWEQALETVAAEVEEHGGATTHDTAADDTEF